MDFYNCLLEKFIYFNGGLLFTIFNLIFNRVRAIIFSMFLCEKKIVEINLRFYNLLKLAHLYAHLYIYTRYSYAYFSNDP